jgi:16S rRNA C967 or C1407 C5-methylase (RsmB/RsmF family)
VNPLKTSARALQEVFKTEGLIDLMPLNWCDGGFRALHWQKPGEMLPFRLGWYWVQEEIAVTAVSALDPRPNDLVLDLCAAPGNKTLQIAQRLGPFGFVVANEWNTGRLSSLGSAIARIGANTIATVNADGCTLPLPNHTFDRVLVDVPCSGEGTLRKHLNRDWSMATSLKAIARIVPIQKRLLSRALDLVKPGGTVVYSTCTFAPEENEAVLDAVLGDRASVDPFDIPGLHHCPGLLYWQGQSFRADLVHAHRYYPHHNDTGGFFVARLRRTDAPAVTSGTASAQTANRFQRIPQNLGEAGLGDRPTPKPASENCPPGDRLQVFRQRFGLPSSALATTDVWTKRNDSVWLVNQSYRAIAPVLTSVDVQNLGLRLFRTVQGHLKPTTAVLQRFGSLMTTNVVELETPEQLGHFLAGRSQPLTGAAISGLEDGYVHVRYRPLLSYPYEVGCGLWVNGVLHSQIPKAMRQTFPHS